MDTCAIFFDIDGTLWDYQQKLIPSTIEAVKQLRSNGHLAFLCSGRGRSAITDRKLLDIGFDGIVGGCGTYFEYHDEIVYSEEVEWEQLQRDVSIFKNNNIAAILEGVEYLYVDMDMFSLDEPYINSLKISLKDTFKEFTDIEPGIRINKYSVDFRNSSEAVLHENFPDYNIVTHAKSTVSEIMPRKDFSKAGGIKRAIEYLGIDHKNTYSFGDSFNDLDMLEYTAHSIAMGNAVKEVKELAEYVTTDVNDNGIYNGLKAFNLI